MIAKRWSSQITSRFTENAAESSSWQSADDYNEILTHEPDST